MAFMRTYLISEGTLTSDKYAHDPRVQLLRNDCPRCGASRGIYCRTPGGYTTLHKARAGAL